MIQGDNMKALGARQLPLSGVVAIEVGGSLPSRLLAKLLRDHGCIGFPP